MTSKTVILALTAALSCAAADLDPKGIFISSGTTGAAASPHPAAKYSIELNRGGKVSQVPPSYRFQTGDRFRFLFELNQASYVYVINRSVEGDPDTMGALSGTRGINVVNQAPQVSQQSAGPKLLLLWPASGAAARMEARQTQSVPGPTQYFEFDATPGLEKIVLLVSPRPVDPSQRFPGLPAGPHPAAARLDTNEDVLVQLKDLQTLDNNTATQPEASRGICVADCSQYSAPKDPNEAFVVTLDLRHYR